MSEKRLMQVYLDNNAATRVDESVVGYMNKYHLEIYAVASSQFSHSPGIRAKEVVDKSRQIIADKIGSKVEEIVFTSGFAESNNLALKGVVQANKNSSRDKIIVSAIEHFSVLHSAQRLSKSGYRLDLLNVDGEGFIDLDHLNSLVDDKTLIVSIMHANHEVGTIQDIKAAADIVHSRGALLHTDCTYSFLQTGINVKELDVDLLTISADLIHGPKGIGALYVREGTKIEKIIDGGYQENNLRGGPENVPGIAGFGRAVEIYKPEHTEKTMKLRDYLYKKITEEIPDIQLNGASDFSKRIPNNLNVSFNRIEGESVVLHLDMRGIAVITGSACFSRALQASHVLLAMGFTHERAHGSIRFSPSRYNTKEEMDYTVENLKEVVEKLRELSPIK